MAAHVSGGSDWLRGREILVIELICHLIGDYNLQNDYMANNKKKSSIACSLHVFMYSLPFVLFCTHDPLAIAFIAGSHFIIDRFGLAVYWTKFYGVGQTAPDYLKVWLTIIVDNSWHLTCNYTALHFLEGLV